jgi:ATP-dependent RNA helicase DeaD
LSKSPSILILEPTRELSVQVANELQMVADCHHMRTTAIYGGVSFSPQVHALRDGVDIVVATSKYNLRSSVLLRSLTRIMA